MKKTGIVRRVDELGRVVIPVELRNTMGIDEKDGIEIYVDEDKIILKKNIPGCMVCGHAKEGMQGIGDKLVCRDCLEDTYQKFAVIESRRLSGKAGGR